MTSSPQSLASAVAGGTGNILSVYLDTNQSNAGNLNRGFENQLASELKNIGQTLKKESERAEFAAAATLVQQFVGRYKPAEHGLVVFANSTTILLSRGLNTDLESEVRWGRPHVKPYLEALDEFERHTIVMTDKSQARIISVFLGTVETSVDIRDNPDTKHLHTAGMDHLWSQSGFQRRADEHVSQHLRHVVQELETMARTHPSNRIVLGGNVEAVAELFHLLPKPLKAKVAGTMPLSMTDSVHHLLKTALQVELKAERDFELKDVERLQEAVGRHKATTGGPDTLQALRERRVLSLYYADGLSIAGRECAACRALFTEDGSTTCGYCGKPTLSHPDLLDTILAQALESGARVEQVRGAGADKLLETGGIGAFLRY